MGRDKYLAPQFDLPGGQQTFLSSGQESYTYQHLYWFSNRLQQQMKDINPSESNPLLVISGSTVETVFLIAASFLLKIPILPLRPDTTRKELEDILAQLKPAAVYTDQDRIKEWIRHLPEITIRKEMFQVESHSKNPQLSLEEPESIAGYFLTSGSTGPPKIVPIKRRQILFAASSSAKNFEPANNKYWLLCLPLNHVGGINVIYRSVLYHSAIYLMDSFDEEKIRDLLHHHKTFEVASMVPTMLVKLMDDPFFRVHFNFKAILLGGGPISMELINRSLTRGLPIVCSYGMTETCAQIAANPMLQPSGMYIPKKSVGSIFEPNKIEIRNDNNEALPFNESGQIWLKGPQIFDGYLDESQNENAFDEDGWFRTGDFGHLNRKGQLFIESRRSDLIITGGENVNPVEIESILNSLERIRESAVVGIPDKKWGQKVTAFVVLDNGEAELDQEQVRTKLKESLRGFKIPKEFIILDQLPKTDTHKIKRTELIKRYGSGH